ncbi:hypothetical protein WMY93_014748 [Mugilogobius chulae]|uniref:G-protein coupled receptors family 1 profile domain-containing protein n=1 Tax=Mugilogobius chulae TaxID=88201 RepID=A0AAW0NWD0_9GOBI
MQVSNNSTVSQDSCVTERSHAVFTSWLVVYLLVFPVFIFVIYFGYKKWQTHRANISHSDVFTFHMVAMEILNLVGSCMYFGGFMLETERILDAGLGLKNFSSVGEMSFHCLTCVERYLAVVQPITYLRLKKRGGVMIRNVSIGCAWLFSAVSVIISVMVNRTTNPLIFGFAVAVLSIVLVSLCSVSVLYVLIRPGPGEGGGDKKRIDQTKRAAAFTLMAILERCY